MAGNNNRAFYLIRFIIFLGATPFAFLVSLPVMLGFEDMSTVNWVNFSLLVFITLLLLIISLFPKFVSRLIFWRASDENRIIYIKRVEIIFAFLVIVPLILFLWSIISGKLLRGLAEI
jgi:hypothetical protein